MISTWRNVQSLLIKSLHFLWLFFSFFFFWSVGLSYSFLSCGMFSSNSQSLSIPISTLSSLSDPFLVHLSFSVPLYILLDTSYTTVALSLNLFFYDCYHQCFSCFIISCFVGEWKKCWKCKVETLSIHTGADFFFFCYCIFDNSSWMYICLMFH